MLLHVENLTKSFCSPEGGKHEVIDIESFQLAPKQQIALSGESGSGKTTFLHLIAGILKADSGKILINGADMTQLGEAGRDQVRAKSLGYIFQTFNLLQGYTCLENVMLGMAFGVGVDRGFAEQLLKRVGLEQRTNYYPRQLSVGQQQRVAVARALANRPKLVLADEPTGNLDHVNARDSLRLIREACRENEAALLLVSHDRDVLNNFENRVDLRVLNRAALSEAGT